MPPHASSLDQHVCRIILPSRTLERRPRYLRYRPMQETLTATLFHNPSAGSGGESHEALQAPFCEVGFNILPVDVRGPDLAQGLSATVDLHIIAGGDGTVGTVATGLTQRSTPCMLLPCGTANNLARALGPWAAPEAAAKHWREARRQTLNIIRMETPDGAAPGRFVEALGAGAFSQAMEQMDAEGQSGLVAGREAFRRCLSQGQPSRVCFRLDGQQREVETLLFEIMNIALIGPNLVLAAEAQPGDGVLHVVTVPPARREAMLHWLEEPGASHPPVDVQRATEVELLWPGGPIRRDDEMMDRSGPMPILCRAEPEPLTFLVPPPGLAAPPGRGAAGSERGVQGHG